MMPPITLTPDTQITIGVAIACIGTAIACTWWLAGKLAEFKSELAEITKKLSDSYTLTRASEVAYRQALHNPSHKVVDPRDPTELISADRRPKSIMDT